MCWYWLNGPERPLWKCNVNIWMIQRSQQLIKKKKQTKTENKQCKSPKVVFPTKAQWQARRKQDEVREEGWRQTVWGFVSLYSWPVDNAGGLWTLTVHRQKSEHSLELTFCIRSSSVSTVPPYPESHIFRFNHLRIM